MLFHFLRSFFSLTPFAALLPFQHSSFSIEKLLRRCSSQCKTCELSAFLLSACVLVSLVLPIEIIYFILNTSASTLDCIGLVTTVNDHLVVSEMGKILRRDHGGCLFVTSHSPKNLMYTHKHATIFIQSNGNDGDCKTGWNDRQKRANEKQQEVEWNQSFEMLTIAGHNPNWWLYAIGACGPFHGSHILNWCCLLSRATASPFSHSPQLLLVLLILCRVLCAMHLLWDERRNEQTNRIVYTAHCMHELLILFKPQSKAFTALLGKNVIYLILET